MHMITVMIVGLAMGATVNIGQAIGAGNKKKAAKDIGNTVTLFMMLAIAGAAGLLFFIKPIVGMMSTPQEAVPETVIYLTICFLGIPIMKVLKSSRCEKCYLFHLKVKENKRRIAA